MLYDLDGYYRANHVFHSQVQALANHHWLDRATNDLRRFMRLLRGRQRPEHELVAASSPRQPDPRSPSHAE
jgi:DNA-binding GntR family transcriptional regulator